MKLRGFVVYTILALALVLGLRSPAQASHMFDPTEETYWNHVIPYYNILPGQIALLVVSDTSFNQFPAAAPKGTVDLFFFNQACNLVRDGKVKLSRNDVEFVNLSTPAFAGIPTQGEIFLTDDADSSLLVDFDCIDCRFITYLLQIDLGRNTITRIDSIPLDSGTQWLRYEKWNTLAATFGDTAPISTTLTFFNAVGGTSAANGFYLGSVDTLREALFDVFATSTIRGDWVVTGGGGPCPACVTVVPGDIHLFAFDAEEAPVGSFIINLRCFERGSLTSFIPTLAAINGHVFGFSIDPAGLGGGGWSAFQETVVELGAVDAPFSGYWHHSD